MGEAFDRLQALLRRETSYSELLAAHVLSPPPVQQRSSSFRAIGEGVSEEDDDWVLTASDRSQMVEWGYHGK